MLGDRPIMVNERVAYCTVDGDHPLPAGMLIMKLCKLVHED